MTLSSLLANVALFISCAIMFDCKLSVLAALPNGESSEGNGVVVNVNRINADRESESDIQTGIVELDFGDDSKFEISKLEYCEGCRETNLLLSKTIADALAKRKKNRDGRSVVKAEEMIRGICNSPSMQRYRHFMTLVCVYLLDTHRSAFVKPFQRGISTQMLTQQFELFRRINVTCASPEIDACPRALTPAEEALLPRTECAACHRVGLAVEALWIKFDSASSLAGMSSGSSQAKRMRAMLRREIEGMAATDATEGASAGSGSTGTNISTDTGFGTGVEQGLGGLGGLCTMLGYLYQPHAWMQDTCEEIIEDRIDGILDVLEEQDAELWSGKTPSDSPSNVMCQRFYNCWPRHLYPSLADTHTLAYTLDQQPSSLEPELETETLMQIQALAQKVTQTQMHAETQETLPFSSAGADTAASDLPAITSTATSASTSSIAAANIEREGGAETINLQETESASTV